MISQPLQYRVPLVRPADSVLAELRDGFSLQALPGKTFSRVYYDTFDWRLYLAGSLLQKEKAGRQQQLIWSDLESGGPKETIRLSGRMPGFVWDFPGGLMKQKLKEVLAMRALLPKVEVTSRVQFVSVLDDEEKTVVRITIDESEAKDPEGKAPALLDGRMTLLPVRGYEREFRQVAQFVADNLSLEPASESQLEEALSALGARPADYTSKLNFKFKPYMPAQQVAKQIHLHLLDTMERNVPGTKADIDSEFLHDLRVAVRRMRSALTQVKGVFPVDAVDRFKEDLGWIGQITGPTRDMDVYLLGFDDYRDSLPEAFRSDLDPLHLFLEKHQKSEHRAMLRHLNSQKFAESVQAWRNFLESPTAPDPTAPKADAPIKSVAAKRIYRTYNRVLTEGLAIGPDTPAEALHDLRKSCKKLRYLLEFFQSLFGKDKVKHLVKALKVLLDNLGEFQDREVQARKLREFAHLMVKEGNAPPDTLLAMGMLVDGLIQRQHHARVEFADKFSSFAADEVREIFAELFSKQEKDKEKGSHSQ